MRKTALLASLLLLVAPALGFDAGLRVVDRVASPEDPARFEVEVENTGFEAKKFSVNVRPYTYWFYTENSHTIRPGENHTFDLFVTPPEDAVQQNYRFEAAVTAPGEEPRHFTDFFTIEQTEDLVIRAFSSEKDSYMPGERMDFQVSILNTAPVRVDNYTVRAAIGDSSTEKQGLPLSPGATGRLALNLQVPEEASPGDRTVTISIIREGELMQTVEQTVEVEKVKSIQRSREADNRLLFYSWKETVENTGNAPAEAQVNKTLPDYLRPITSFSPEPDRTFPAEDSTTYSWTFSLEPGEEESAGYTTDYWIPGSILAALVAGLLILKRVRTRLSFTKRARRTDEGVKIHLELENRSGEPVHDLEIEDFVPDIASVSDEFSMARPVIRKTSNGTRLSWEIEELEPGGQRVFEYTINPRFEVEGGVNLPGAELKTADRKIADTGEAEAEFQPDDT